MKIHPHFRLLFAALFGTSLLSLSHRASGQEDPTPPPADKSPAQASPERPGQPEPPAKGATREDEKNLKESRARRPMNPPPPNRSPLGGTQISHHQRTGKKPGAAKRSVIRLNARPWSHRIGRLGRPRKIGRKSRARRRSMTPTPRGRSRLNVTLGSRLLRTRKKPGRPTNSVKLLPRRLRQSHRAAKTAPVSRARNSHRRKLPTRIVRTDRQIPRERIPLRQLRSSPSNSSRPKPKSGRPRAKLSASWRRAKPRSATATMPRR
jgi:hypothetical protein